MSIRVVTRREIIRLVPANFTKTYADYKTDTRLWNGRTHGQMLADLNALDVETATHAEVSAIMGNESWSRLLCDECGTDCEVIVRLGDEPEWEARWVDICAACLDTARGTLA